MFCVLLGQAADDFGDFAALRSGAAVAAPAPAATAAVPPPAASQGDFANFTDFSSGPTEGASATFPTSQPVPAQPLVPSYDPQQMLMPQGLFQPAVSFFVSFACGWRHISFSVCRLLSVFSIPPLCFEIVVFCGLTGKLVLKPGLSIMMICRLNSNFLPVFFLNLKFKKFKKINFSGVCRKGMCRYLVLLLNQNSHSNTTSVLSYTSKLPYQRQIFIQGTIIRALALKVLKCS